MHTVWKGSISFGLVNIPIRMFTATEEKSVRFRQLHDQCHTPIRYQRTCPTCDREVERDEIVKGYEMEQGRFIILTEEELEAAKPETEKTINIVDFVELSHIDPVYFNKTYYLSPQETGERAYSLLRQAMFDTDKIGIAQFTLRSKQSLAAVRVYDDALVLETIFYPDEVRAVGDIPGLPKEVSLPEKELNMAQQLIEQLVTPFAPEKYVDEYRESLLDIIQKKTAGEEIQEAPAERPHKVVDLMEALKASLDQTKEKDKRA